MVRLIAKEVFESQTMCTGRMSGLLEGVTVAEKAEPQNGIQPA